MRVIIVNPETRGPLGDSHLGEVTKHTFIWAITQNNLFQLCITVHVRNPSIYSAGSVWQLTSSSLSCLVFQIWVSSPHNASGYYTIYGEESLQADHFNTRLSFGDTETLWARTGYLGFVRRTELLDARGGLYCITDGWLLWKYYCKMDCSDSEFGFDKQYSQPSLALPTFYWLQHNKLYICIIKIV